MFGDSRSLRFRALTSVGALFIYGEGTIYVSLRYCADGIRRLINAISHTAERRKQQRTNNRNLEDHFKAFRPKILHVNHKADIVFAGILRRLQRGGKRRNRTVNNVRVFAVCRYLATRFPKL